MKQPKAFLTILSILTLIFVTVNVKAQCPEITSINEIQNCKEGSALIVITVSNPENVVYSLDGENFQDSNLFTIYESGDYLVYINDGISCTDTGTFQASIDQSTSTTVSSSIEYIVDRKLFFQQGESGSNYLWFRNDEPLTSELSRFLILDRDDEDGEYSAIFTEAGSCAYSEKYIFTKSTLAHFLNPESATINCNSVSNLGTYTLSLGNATAGEPDGAFVINMANNEPFVFSIDDGVTYNCNSSFTNLTSGTYEVIVFDGENCMTIEVEIPVYEEQTENYLDERGNICRTLTLEVNHPDAFDYQWYRNGIPLENDTEKRIGISTFNSDEGDSFYASFSTSAGNMTTGRYFIEETVEYFTDLGNTYICEGDHIFFSGLNLFETGQYQFKTSASDGCDSTIYLNLIVVSETQCGELYISGSLFYDNNRNGLQDHNERGIRELPITISSHNTTLFASSNGRFFHLGEEGESYNLGIDLSEEPLDKWELTTDFSEFSFVFEKENNDHQDLNIGLVHSEDFFDGEIYLSPIENRCNVESRLSLKFRNTGTDILEDELVVLTFELDPKYTFLESNPMPLLQANNLLTYEFSDLKSYEQRSIDLKVQTPDESHTGEEFIIKASAILTRNGEEIELDNYIIQDVVRCSYDPNDKQVSPIGLGEENYTLFEEKLTYTIRFQNTGNDVAYDVSIKDVLDESLDLNTFKIVGSSHEMTTILERNEVEFLFKNIFLPDSISNEPLSHGYVIYEIETLEGIPENTLISNTADIFFDQNPPITTNTTENLMVEMFPTSNIPEEVKNTTVDISVYPNPITQEQLLTIHSEMGQKLNLTITDKLGRTILKKSILKNTKTVSMQHFLPGLYFCKLQGEGVSRTFKLIVS